MVDGQSDMHACLLQTLLLCRPTFIACMAVAVQLLPIYIYTCIVNCCLCINLNILIEIKQYLQMISCMHVLVRQRCLHALALASRKFEWSHAGYPKSYTF